jgi:hypothetical protein
MTVLYMGTQVGMVNTGHGGGVALEVRKELAQEVLSLEKFRAKACLSGY